MVLRLSLICHGPTSATRAGLFPSDEPLDSPGLTRARASSFRVGCDCRCLRSPAFAAGQTADALSLPAEIVPDLRDCDYGTWTARSLDDVYADDPAGVALWLSDPASSPHGGESLHALIGRTSRWLDAQDQAGQIVVVTHASVIRAVIVTVLQAPPQAFWRVDVSPLSVTRLRRRAEQWTLVSTGFRMGRRSMAGAGHRPSPPTHST